MSPVPPISTTEALAPPSPVGLPQQQNFLLQSRARMDALVLKTIRSADRGAAAGLRDLSQTLAALPDWPQSAYFWTLCAAYFEAIALGLSAPDDSHKRLSSKILLVYMALARSELPPWDELSLQLLDVCAQAAAKQQQQAANAQANTTQLLLGGQLDAGTAAMLGGAVRDATAAADQTKRQQSAQFGAALGGGHLIRWQGVRAFHRGLGAFVS